MGDFLVKNRLIFILCLFLLFGCSNKEESKTIPKYKGDDLRIGIVGEIPTFVKEKNINFKKITLNDLNQKSTDSFDAIMITKEHLKKASNEKYTDFYLKSSIPVIFVQSDKAISAFITPGHTYESTFENYAQDYFIGYYKGTNFGITLNGDTSEDLEEGYSNLFILLDKFKQTNKE